MAQQMVERIREAEARAEETLRGAQRQAAQRLEEARAQANDIYRCSEEECRAETARRLEEARGEAEEIRQQAEREAAQQCRRLDERVQPRRAAAVRLAAEELLRL